MTPLADCRAVGSGWRVPIHGIYYQLIMVEANLWFATVRHYQELASEGFCVGACEKVGAAAPLGLADLCCCITNGAGFPGCCRGPSRARFARRLLREGSICGAVRRVLLRRARG